MKRRKRSTLTVFWVRWRRHRYQSLLAQKLNIDLAWEIASTEAKYRHGVGKIIGRNVARDIEIAALGEHRVIIPGSVPGLTPAVMENIAELNSRAMPTEA